MQRDYQNADGEAQIVNEWILCREAESHPLTDDPYFACPEGQLVFNAPTGPSGDEPPEVPSLRQTLEGYHRSMQFLAQKVYRCFALSLGLPEDFFVSKASRAPSQLLQTAQRCWALPNGSRPNGLLKRRRRRV